MIKKAIGLTILAVATLVVVPAPARAQMNPALIGEGAVIWGNNCGRCHNVRATTERSDDEWTVIVMHMRARANLTSQQALAVLTYLQATNTPTGQGSAEGAAAPTQAAETRDAAPRPRGPRGVHR